MHVLGSETGHLAPNGLPDQGRLIELHMVYLPVRHASSAEKESQREWATYLQQRQPIRWLRRARHAPDCFSRPRVTGRTAALYAGPGAGELRSQQEDLGGIKDPQQQHDQRSRGAEA